MAEVVDREIANPKTTDTGKRLEVLERDGRIEIPIKI